MQSLLNQLELEWKKIVAYTDVKASYLNKPSDEQMEDMCPHGCTLKVHHKSEGDGPWRAISESKDAYRQTRSCITHGYARIYVIEGLNAANANYKIET